MNGMQRGYWEGGGRVVSSDKNLEMVTVNKTIYCWLIRSVIEFFFSIYIIRKTVKRKTLGIHPLQ